MNYANASSFSLFFIYIKNANAKSDLPSYFFNTYERCEKGKNIIVDFLH